jgi:hypothetical protein
MNTSGALPTMVGVLAGCTLLLVTPPSVRADDEVTAVFSKVVSKDYVRKKFPDGSYQPEEYFLKNGGRYDELGGSYDKPSGDASIDNKSYLDIARVIAEQLATQNYDPAKDLKTGKLIIVVRWGTTVPPDSGIPALKQTSSPILNAQQAPGKGGSGPSSSTYLDPHAMTLYAFDMVGSNIYTGPCIHFSNIPLLRNWPCF